MNLTSFPQIVVFKRLPKGVLARYMERAKPRRIELTPDILAYERRTQMQIALHEIGHWFRNEHVARSEMKDEESFARDFVSYFLIEKQFKREKPERHQQFAEWLSGQRGRIRAFARKCLSQLAASANGAS